MVMWDERGSEDIVTVTVQWGNWLNWFYLTLCLFVVGSSGNLFDRL